MASPGRAALCVCAAMARSFHPQLIAETHLLPGLTVGIMIDFILGGLRQGAV